MKEYIFNIVKEIVKKNAQKKFEDSVSIEEERGIYLLDFKREEALKRTTVAKRLLDWQNDIHKYVLDVKNVINFEKLSVPYEFDLSKPEKPELKPIPFEPKLSNDKYKYTPFISRVISYIDAAINYPTYPKYYKKEELEKAFKKDFDDWKKKKEDVEKQNNSELKKYEQESLLWTLKRKEWVDYKNELSLNISNFEENYFKKEQESIIMYNELLLLQSPYPKTFPKEHAIDYNPENKILIVEFNLPYINAISRLKEVKYNATYNQFKKYYLSDSAFNKLYETVLYGITIRTLYEIFNADLINAIQSVVFNGWVHSLNKGTGQYHNACILSLHVSKNEFQKINIANIDPKSCFRSLKGVGSSKLYTLTSIEPILKIDRKDKRFILPQEIAEKISEGTNIAAIPWEDFEHLIREIFEKEFSQYGGEVHVTQASRDRGVDAIAFDPDPIRGGKIVIQAKRYTNTVGVSAVRDLYGTIINEGATKGILITTANYGPDAYDFAKGKPLTLLTGNNLLHLLEKHGHKARIDLKEAKRLNKDTIN